MDDLYDFHPGATIKDDYLEGSDVTVYRLAKALNMGQSHVADIIDGKRGVTANVAIRLAKVFGTTPEFWLNMQNRYDMLQAHNQFDPIYQKIERIHIGA